MIKALHDDDPQVRHLIPGALGRLGESSDDVIAPLAEMLAKDPDGQVGQAVVQALHRVALHRAVGDPGLKTIVEALGHAATDHPEPRSACRRLRRWAAWEKRDWRADALSRASDNPNSYVRDAARAA